MSRDWANLPNGILGLVLERLESAYQFSSVCKAWRSAAKNKQSHCLLKTPLLLISERKKTIWNLYNVANKKVLTTQLNSLNNRFCGSSQGWLIVIDENAVVCLINPFFKVRGKREKPNSIIRLPPLKPPHYKINRRLKQRYDYFIYKATLSADPVSDANDCVVTVIYEERCQVAFIRLNKDKDWTYVDKSIRAIEEVLLFGNKFYAVDWFGKLFSIDVTTRPISCVNLVSHGFQTKNYLVVSNDKKLLMVERSIEDDGYKARVTKKFRIFELNFTKCKWIEKKTLGDAAIFVGDNSSICVSASNLGYEPNCIYFTHDNDRGGFGFGPSGPCDCGVYSIAYEKNLQHYTEQVKALIKKTTRPPVWVVPTYQL